MRGNAGMAHFGGEQRVGYDYLTLAYCVDPVGNAKSSLALGQARDTQS